MPVDIFFSIIVTAAAAATRIRPSGHRHPSRPHSLLLTLACLTASSPTAQASFFSTGRTMLFVTTRDGKGTITVSPKNEAEQSGLVVICHGLGDSAEGFVDVAEHMASQMPHLKFILPTAPTQPVTMNMGMAMPSWYDIVGLDERSNENCKGIEQSRDIIRSILQKEHDSSGLPYSRMVLAGFSQGGALNLFTGMQLDGPEQKLGGIVLMSGYLPCSQQFKITPGLEDTPILHCHGTSDPMVQHAMAIRSREHVVERGSTSYELKSYNGVQHTVSPEEISDVSMFLAKVLPLDDTCRVKLKDPSEMSIKELRESIRKAGLGSKAVGLMEKSEFVKLVQDHRDGKL